MREGRGREQPPESSNRLRSAALLAGLTLLGLIGNIFSAPLFFGVDFLFGSIAVMYLVLRQGIWRGALSAAIAASYTYLLWDHPYAVIIFTAEAVTVGLLVRRLRWNPLVADGVYWTTLGAAQVWVFYVLLLNTHQPQTLLIVLKQGLNGFFNVLVITLLLTFGGLRRASAREVSIRDALFPVMVALVLLPAMILMIVGSRRDLARIQENQHERVNAAGLALTAQIEGWLDPPRAAVAELAHVAGDASPPELQAAAKLVRGAFPQFHNVYVADERGRTIAFHPPQNEQGLSTLGLDFSDRPYFDRTRQAQGPLVSEVFLGRGGVAEPIVAVTAPVRQDGEFRGIALGALEVAVLRADVSRLASLLGLHAVLTDAEDRVIASSRPDEPPLSSYRGGAGGELTPLESGHYRWSPHGAMAAMTRWRRSLLGAEIPLGDGWRLRVELPFEPSFRALESRFIERFSNMGLLSVVALLVAALLSGRLARPLTRLAERTSVPAATLLSLPPPAPERSGMSEIDLLDENFTRLTRALQQHFDELSSARGDLETRTRQLAQLNEELQAADQAKNQFLAMLGHELRNPLAPVSTAVELLRVRGRDDRSLEVIERQVTHIRRLVDDLLDVSRITRGSIALQRRPFDLRSAVEAAVEVVRAQLESRSQRLVTRLPDTPVPVHGDPTRLEQVCINLLQNASKYSNEGANVAVEVSAQGGEAALSVRDDGIGIAKEFLPRVFDLFAQNERSLERSQGGLGVGLTLVRSLVELHGGRVTAASEGLGKGSDFRVVLPLHPYPLEAQPTTPAPVSQAPRRRVLVVDDNVDAAESLVDLLQVWGHEAECVHTPEEALARLDAFRPDVLLLDIGLPGMNGYELARRIRKRKMGEGFRLVALTGYGQAEDRQRSREAGFDLHLTKPVDPDELQRSL
jgi:signal transduction histidine kinase/CheY-like chemotaxis protein